MIIKKFTTLLLLMTFFTVFLNSNVNAETPPTDGDQARTRINDRQDKAERKRIELRDSINTKRATRQAQLSRKRQRIIYAHLNTIHKRIDATLQRLEVLITRIESRVDIIVQNSADEDLTDINRGLEMAKEKTEELRLENLELQSMAEEIYNSDDAKTSFETYRLELTNIKTGIKELHTSLMQIVREIKGLRTGQQ